MNGTELLPHDGRAVLHERVFQTGLFEELRDGLDWKQEAVRIFGKAHPVPRLAAFYGELPYSYSGIVHPARAMPPRLRELANHVEEISGYAFNSVLANWYRDGSDGMGYHRDDEPEIDPACIASVSFGASRRFKMRHRDGEAVVTVELGDGALLLMHDCQEHWEHGVPKTRRPVEGRINLTFRRMREAD